MNFAEVWAHLEQDHRSGSGMGRMQRRITPEYRRDFFLALELPSRNRMLILRAAPASVAGQAPIPESRGLTVRMRVSEADPSATEVELILTDQQHRDIFDLLIEDLVEAAEQPDDERAGVRKFLARLADWQRLLMRLAPGTLSIENRQGLWGELWTLREVAVPAVGFGAAVRAWRGPFGADQDIQLSGAALEVKTSTAHAFERLMIASERQLDVPRNVVLALIALSLDARPNLGETLPEMVQSIRILAADAGCQQVIDERLLLSGYKLEDADTYSDIGYTIRSRVQFRIENDFPRVVPTDLRQGVGEVRYSIAVTACSQFEVTEGELEALLRERL